LNRTRAGGTRRQRVPAGIGVKRLGQAAIAVGVVALLLVGALANGQVVGNARANAVVTVSASTFVVNATGTFSFSPSKIQNVPTNQTVTVSFSNYDTSGAPHTFTIIGCEGINFPTTANPSDYINGSKCAKAPLVNVVSSSSTPMNVPFPAPATGWYEFLCTQSGHLYQGMRGYIAFGMDLPTNLTTGGPDTGPGLAVFIIVGTIVALTVIAIVLGFVVGRREGGQHEMPPERLGYPEPLSPPARPPTPPVS